MEEIHNSLSLQQIAFLNTPIKYLNLSNRVTNFFNSQGFENFGDILPLYDHIILAMPNIGRNSRREMTLKLRQQDLYFGFQSMDEVSLSYYKDNDIEKYEQIMHLISKETGIIFINNNYTLNPKQIAFLNIPYYEFKLSARLKNFFEVNNFNKFSDIFSFQISYLKTLSNVGKKSISELENILMKYGLHFGFVAQNEYRLDYYEMNEPSVYQEILEFIENITFTSFENFDFNELDFNTRDIVIFKTRILGKKTLEDLGKEFGVHRERIRQLEATIFKRIFNYLGQDNVIKYQKQFTCFFNKTEKLIKKSDLILNIKIYKGIEKFNQFEKLVTKLSEYVTKKYPKIPSILHELVNEEIVFYPSFTEQNLAEKNQNQKIIDLSYNQIQKLVKEEFKKIKEFTLTDESKIKLFVEEKVRKVGRPDLLSCISDLVKPLINNDKIINLKAFMIKQDKTLSKKEIYKILIDDPIIFNGIVDNDVNKFRYITRLVDELENCYEFEYAKYGFDKIFGIVDHENRNIISDKLYKFMSKDKSVQYSSSALLKNVEEIIESHKINLLRPKNDLNEYQVSWILKKDYRLNNSLFSLGRGIWSIENNQKREEIKYVISEILEKENRPLNIKDLIVKIEKIRQLRTSTTFFIQNYIITHCDNLSLIVENGENKAILNSWIKENKYTFFIARERDKFDDLKKIIVKFIKVHGHCNISSTYTLEDGRVVGRKIYHLRKQYFENELDEKTIEIIESIDGWNWEGTKKLKSIDDIKNLLINFYNEFGHHRIPTDYKIENEYNLYNGYLRIRKAYHAGLIDNKIIRELEILNGWSWEIKKQIKFPQDTSYIKRPSSKLNYNLLSEKVNNFIKENGHCNMTSKHKDQNGFGLGMAIYSLRRKYDDGILDKEVIEIFNNIEGWAWKIKRRYQSGFVSTSNGLKERINNFISKNGHSNISSHQRDKDGYSLGAAIYNLRKQFANNNLDQDRINVFNTIEGWDWNAQYQSKTKMDFFDQINFIKRYQLEFGNLKPKLDEEIYGVKLGRFISRFRERYHKGVLDTKFILELESIEGWEWASRNQSGNYKLGNSNDVFNLLDQYYIEHGNFNFPVSYKVNEIKLGEILYNIRRRYQKDIQSIDPDLIKSLESYSCWSWNHHKKTIFRYDIKDIILEIDNYRKSFGDIQIHRNYEINDIKLGQFLDRCKRQYNAGELKEEIIKSLNDIEGWNW